LWRENRHFFSDNELKAIEGRAYYVLNRMKEDLKSWALEQIDMGQNIKIEQYDVPGMESQERRFVRVTVSAKIGKEEISVQQVIEVDSLPALKPVIGQSNHE